MSSQRESSKPRTPRDGKVSPHSTHPNRLPLLITLVRTPINKNWKRTNRTAVWPYLHSVHPKHQHTRRQKNALDTSTPKLHYKMAWKLEFYASSLRYTRRLQKIRRCRWWISTALPTLVEYVHLTRRHPGPNGSEKPHSIHPAAAVEK